MEAVVVHRCPFCGERLEESGSQGFQKHAKACLGPPLTVVREHPLVIMLGIHEGGYYPGPAVLPAAEVLARGIAQLRQRYPDRRFTFIPIAAAWQPEGGFAGVSPKGVVLHAQSIVTTLLAVEEE